MRLKDCHNLYDFRTLAKKRLPAPVFGYIDGAADDELTHRRNTSAFDDCDLVPNVLAGVEDIDLSVEVMGQKLDMPVYCSPTALQRLFHHRGERAVAAAAEKFGTLFGVSTHGTVSIEDIARQVKTPQVYQYYFSKNPALNQSLLERAKDAGVPILMLTVDTITAGNRERDKRSGFSAPLRLKWHSALEFVRKPRWLWDYLTHEPFSLPQLDDFIDMSLSPRSQHNPLGQVFDSGMSWQHVKEMVKFWDGQFCLKGVMSAADARRAVDIGCTGIVVSNHGGRQLDGSRSAFDGLAEIVDAVGKDIDVLFDSGVYRGSHVLKALSLGAKAVGLGRGYLYPLAAGGQPAVERALELMRDELTRGMKLMGRRSIGELSPENLRFR